MRLEIDHIVPRGRGGPSTIDNCRLACKFHNQLAARQVCGAKHMDLFTRSVPMAREAEAPTWEAARLDSRTLRRATA